MLAKCFFVVLMLTHKESEISWRDIPSFNSEITSRSRSEREARPEFGVLVPDTATCAWALVLFDKAVFIKLRIAGLACREEE